MDKEKPVIVQKFPYRIELEPGTYWWCKCGRSKNQPFCDGSHKETSFQPLEFKVTQKQTLSLCSCKHTNKEPFCDGTHKTL